jgi:hypothetical protein
MAKLQELFFLDQQYEVNRSQKGVDGIPIANERPNLVRIRKGDIGPKTWQLAGKTGSLPPPAGKKSRCGSGPFPATNITRFAFDGHLSDEFDPQWSERVESIRAAC